MKAFRFRLQHLLGLREQEEELLKLRLGKATRTCDEIRISLDEVRTEQVRSHGGGGTTADFLVRQAWLSRLSRDRKDLEGKAADAEARRLEVMAEYVTGRQHAEVLRKLREKNHGEWRKAQVREQDALQDDLVQARLLSADHREATEVDRCRS